MFRTLKMGRYSEALKLIGDVLRKTKEELLTTVFVITVPLVITSTLMFFAEHEAQPFCLPVKSV